MAFRAARNASRLGAAAGLAIRESHDSLVHRRRDARQREHARRVSLVRAPLGVDGGIRVPAEIICFDVRGMGPPEVVEGLRAKRIIATATPYVPSYARVSPSILNTPAEIQRTLDVLRTFR